MCHPNIHLFLISEMFYIQRFGLVMHSLILYSSSQKALNNKKPLTSSALRFHEENEIMFI